LLINSGDLIWGNKHCVKCVLDNVFESLKKDSKRIFNEVEVYYFKKWYEQLNEQDKNIVN